MDRDRPRYNDPSRAQAMPPARPRYQTKQVNDTGGASRTDAIPRPPLHRPPPVPTSIPPSIPVPGSLSSQSSQSRFRSRDEMRAPSDAMKDLVARRQQNRESSDQAPAIPTSRPSNVSKSSIQRPDIPSPPTHQHVPVNSSVATPRRWKDDTALSAPTLPSKSRGPINDSSMALNGRSLETVAPSRRVMEEPVSRRENPTRMPTNDRYQKDLPAAIPKRRDPTVGIPSAASVMRQTPGFGMNSTDKAPARRPRPDIPVDLLSSRKAGSEIPMDSVPPRRARPVDPASSRRPAQEIPLDSTSLRSQRTDVSNPTRPPKPEIPSDYIPSATSFRNRTRLADDSVTPQRSRPEIPATPRERYNNLKYSKTDLRPSYERIQGLSNPASASSSSSSLSSPTKIINQYTSANSKTDLQSAATPTASRPRNAAPKPHLIHQPVSTKPQRPPARSNTNTPAAIEEPSYRSAPTLKPRPKISMEDSTDLKQSSDTKNKDGDFEFSSTFFRDVLAPSASASSPSLTSKPATADAPIPTNRTTKEPSLKPPASRSLPELTPPSLDQVARPATDVTYKPISATYQRRLIDTLYARLETSSDIPSKSDFLTEEGYYRYLEETENQGEEPRFEPLLAEMIRLWDIRHPLMSEDHLKPKTSSNANDSQASIRKAPQTTVNLVVRVIQAKGLPQPKDGIRNCFAAIEYPMVDSEEGKKKRYETQVCPQSMNPSWDQHITLTVKSLMQPVLVTLYDQTSKQKFFGSNETRDEFLGCIKLDVGTLVSETAKNGFVDRWYKLNNTDSGKDKHKKISVQGEIRIEVEMGGILNDSSKDTSDVKADPELQPLLNDLEQLNKIQHRLITYKINLKSLYRILIDALIEMDLCVKDGQEIHMLKEDDLHWGLSKDADSILKEFANVWVISDAFRKMKLLESIFHNYKEERIHGRALLAAYKSLYEGIFKRNTQPVFLELLSEIERYLTEQIQKFKDYFPVTTNSHAPYITSSLQSIVYLCRMIDKNPFLIAIHGDKGSKPPEEYDSDDENGVPKLGITDYDYNKDGKFSFTEKLKGIFQTRAVLRYQQLSELASPMDAAETIENLVFKSAQLTKLLYEEVEEDRRVYKAAFDKEIDIIPIEIEKFMNLFCLEMENMSEVIRRRNTASLMKSTTELAEIRRDSQSSEEELANQLPRNEDQLLSMALELMELVHVMQVQWKIYAPSVKSNFNYVLWFTPFIIRWLELTEKKTIEWVQNAIKVDTFEPQGSSLTSSSPIDIFQAMFESLAFLKKATIGFEQEPNYHAMFMTRFSQIAFSAVSAYCNQMEELADKDAALSSDNPNGSSSNNIGQTVWKWFGSANSEQQIENIPPIDHSTTAVRISNIDLLRKRLGALYQELEGSKVHQTCSEWLNKKADTYRKSNPNRDREAVTGVIRIGIFMAEDLKARSNGLYVAKTNPYIVIQENFAESMASRTSQISSKSGTNSENYLVEVARSHVVPDSLCPVFQVLNPELLQHMSAKSRRTTDSAHQRFKFLGGPLDYVCVVENARDLEVEVYHRAETNAFSSFISTSANDTVVARGKLKLSRTVLRSTKRTFHWVNLSPQGRVLVSVNMPIEGVPMTQSRGPSSQLSYEDSPGSVGVHFGVGGVQHLDYWFLRMDSAIQLSKEILFGKIIDKMQGPMNARWAKIVKDAALGQGNTANANITDKEADDALGPIVDSLNDQLSILSSSLSDQLAQTVIFSIWQKCVLLPVLHQLIPMSFYSDANASGKPLDERQVSMIIRCVGLLSAFFHADGQGLGLPMEALKSGSHWYTEMAAVQSYYHEPTSQLVHKLRSGNMKDLWVLVKLLRLRGMQEGWPANGEKVLQSLLVERTKLLAEGELIL